MNIPTSHPRYASLKTRELIENGVDAGITSPGGLIAHGRGEAFDYLIGEKTHEFAKNAISAAAALLLLAKHPVISVNGNTAALVSKEFIRLSRLIDAPLEVNLFHPSQARLVRIKNHLVRLGAKKVLLPDNNYTLPNLESNRKYIHPEGIAMADVVFVPLEDGDRTKALIHSGKKVITVDLNPLSRTAQQATITIVDAISRALPVLITTIKQYQKIDEHTLKQFIMEYDNKNNLIAALGRIVQNFQAYKTLVGTT